MEKRERRFKALYLVTLLIITTVFMTIFAVQTKNERNQAYNQSVVIANAIEESNKPYTVYPKKQFMEVEMLAITEETLTIKKVYRVEYTSQLLVIYQEGVKTLYVPLDTLYWFIITNS